jgi:hypothetical protein
MGITAATGASLGNAEYPTSDPLPVVDTVGCGKEGGYDEGKLAGGMPVG